MEKNDFSKKHKNDHNDINFTASNSIKHTENMEKVCRLADFMSFYHPTVYKLSLYSPQNFSCPTAIRRILSEQLQTDGSGSSAGTWCIGTGLRILSKYFSNNNVLASTFFFKILIFHKHTFSITKT